MEFRANSVLSLLLFISRSLLHFITLKWNETRHNIQGGSKKLAVVLCQQLTFFEPPCKWRRDNWEEGTV